GDPEVFNKSLPSITYAMDQNGTPRYLLSIPTSGLNQNTYEISIYTWTSKSNHLLIGKLGTEIKIVPTLSPPQIIQLHEVIILILGGVFIFLAYQNLKKVP
ncbi:MAG: hypothetical protein ACXACR_11595, partial [Candidatus Hodarchaeales archaeon]